MEHVKHLKRVKHLKHLFDDFLGLGGAVGVVGYFDVEAGEWLGAFVALEVVVAHCAHRFRSV